MAGDWIKMRTNLWDDPRVAAVCDRLDIGEATVVGALFRLWSMADEHTEDGKIPAVTPTAVDRKVGVKGFAQALADAGWLVINDGAVVIPRFNEHNGASAKKRSRDARRRAGGRKGGTTRSDDASEAPSERPSGVTEASSVRARPRPSAKPKEESPNGDSCPEPQAAASGPEEKAGCVAIFPCVGAGPKTWGLTETKVREWEEAFPGVDVRQECLRARQWLRDNPQRGKTASGMAKFLSGWLGRQQNSGAPRGSPSRSGSRFAFTQAFAGTGDDSGTDSEALGIPGLSDGQAV